jgi:uncharacterized membrane protein
LAKAEFQTTVLAELKMDFHQPLYAEEPRFILLDRREEQEDSPDVNPKEDDLFWVTRGRRQYELPFPAEYGQPFWASMSRLRDLVPDEKLSRVSRSRLTENGFLEAEAPFWAARGKRSSFKFVEGLRHRYGVPKSLSGIGLCWSSRCRRLASDDSRKVRGFLKSLPVEDPFWAARGKKSDLHGEEELRDRCRQLISISAEKSFWPHRGKRSAADGSEEELRDRCRILIPMSPGESFWTQRGERSATDGSEELRQRSGLLEFTSVNEPAWMKQPALHCAQRSETKRGLLESLSVEDPFWVARERRKDGELGEKPQRRGGLLDSLSADEPFWAARGRRGFLDSMSNEKPFWAARGKRESLLMTSPSEEALLSQVSILNDMH